MSAAVFGIRLLASRTRGSSKVLDKFPPSYLSENEHVRGLIHNRQIGILLNVFDGRASFRQKRCTTENPKYERAIDHPVEPEVVLHVHHESAAAEAQNFKVAVSSVSGIDQPLLR